MTTMAEGEQMTFRDKKKFFEKEIEEHVTGKKPNAGGRKFSYLQDHEVAKLHTEEERKKSLMSDDEVIQYRQDKLGTDGTDYKTILVSSGPKPPISSAPRPAKTEQRRFIKKNHSSSPRRSRPTSGDGIHGNNLPGNQSPRRSRPSSAAYTDPSDGNHGNQSPRRSRPASELYTDGPIDVHDNNGHHGNSDDDNTGIHGDGDHKLSPSSSPTLDDRVIQAEKRAAWRKARMDSLVEDAIRAQAVISLSQERNDTHDKHNSLNSRTNGNSPTLADKTNGHHQ